MRVLYDARLAHRGLGISTFVVQLAAALARTQEVELVWLGNPTLAPPGIGAAVRVDRRPYPLLDGPAGRALARRLRPDLIHFTGNTGWASNSSVPSVLTLHDLIFLDSSLRSRSLRQQVGHRYERLLVPYAARRADVLVVPSHTVAAQVRARFGRSRAPSVVHGGVEAVTRIEDAGGEAPAPARAGPADPPYIVAFAGRDPRKNTPAVVAAWRQLASAPLHLHLLAAGGMPPGLRVSLEPELAAGTVAVHPHLPRARVWSLLTGALALVYPSSDEGFGLPVLEAMAAGIPVLTGIAPVTREIGGDAIVQLDPADIVGSTAAAVRRLLADPISVADLGARGRAQASLFTWEAAAAGYLAAYREAIERHR
jgi:glycosyltransferase involved in cell wall biosynthesis